MEERMLAREEQREIDLRKKQREIEFRKKMEKWSHLPPDSELRKQIEGFLCSCGGCKFRGEVMCGKCYWSMEWFGASPDLPEEEDE